ncbi:MAG: hypothetical protein Q7K55_04470 [Candidatus Levybacteria bacterium]|nr:hypothetical protein [Candidatus Levybacteria bacterium]
MIDTAQAVLLFVIIILTSLLLILGVQVFFILRELRQTISKANKVLDDTGVITESVSGPISSISTLASGVKTGAAIVSLFNRKKKVVKRIIEEASDGE